MAYLIVAENELKPFIDLAKFQVELARRWPEAKVSTALDDGAHLTWTMMLASEPFLGRIFSRKVVTLEADEASIAEFSVWYRKLIPNSIDLALCHDEIPEVNLSISWETTEADLLAMLAGKP